MRWVVVICAAVVVAACGNGSISRTQTPDPDAATIAALETAFDPHDPTIIAQLTALVPTRIALETEQAPIRAAAATRIATDALVTPSIPEFTSPVTMMYCEGLQEHGQAGAGAALATVPDGSRVVYKAGSCEPDVDASGGVAVRNDDGSVGRVMPEYTTSWQGNTENIVWTPAKGELNGVPTTLTAKYLEHDAKVQFDQLGQALVTFSLNADGQQVMRSLTTRIGGQADGLPLAAFIDGAPIRGKDGHVIAPRVLSVITDLGQTTGLASADAHRIADGINSGMLQ